MRHSTGPQVEQSTILRGETMARAKQKWKIGDVFGIPTPDGKYVVAQIIAQEPEVLNSVSVAIFDARIEGVADARDISLESEAVFSTVFTTRDLLDSGDWPIIENGEVVVPRSLFPHKDKRSTGFVGAKVIGSGIVNEFVSAFYGLVPWDDWKDPHYLDALLLSPEKKPANVLLKSQM